MIIVFSHEREEMLLANLQHLDKFEEEVFVIDDNSKFDMDPINEWANVYQSTEHLGKKNFWLQWRTALSIARTSKDDLFVFMPDDFLNLNFLRILELAETLDTQLNGGAYCVNLINDGREQCFRPFHPLKRIINNEPFLQVGFTDGGFFCNRATLKLLNFRMDPVDPVRFQDPNRSSGVGEQLTKRMRNENVYMLLPEVSLAYHGDHESKMNPEERKRHPLISKH